MSNGTGNDLGPIGKGMAPLASLERKPLPGIQSIGSISAKSQSWAGLNTIKETSSPTSLVSIFVSIFDLSVQSFHENDPPSVCSIMN